MIFPIIPRLTGDPANQRRHYIFWIFGSIPKTTGEKTNMVNDTPSRPKNPDIQRIVFRLIRFYLSDIFYSNYRRYILIPHIRNMNWLNWMVEIQCCLYRNMIDNVRICYAYNHQDMFPMRNRGNNKFWDQQQFGRDMPHTDLTNVFGKTPLRLNYLRHMNNRSDLNLSMYYYFLELNSPP